jgi:hypothetical protein
MNAPLQMTPTSFFQRTQALWTAVIIGSLAGCTHNTNDADRTRAEGATAGAALGAAAGAGVAALATHGTKPGAIIGGAAAGALVGGLAGAAYGNSVANKKAGYATKESALDAQISGLHRQVVARQEYNEKLKGVVAAKQQQLNSILASDRAAGPSVQDFDLRTTITSKLSEIDQQSRSWQETIDAHKAVMKKATEDPRGGDLQKEIDHLTEQRAELLRQRAILAAIPDKLNRPLQPKP